MLLMILECPFVDLSCPAKPLFDILASSRSQNIADTPEVSKSITRMLQNAAKYTTRQLRGVFVFVESRETYFRSQELDTCTLIRLFARPQLMFDDNVTKQVFCLV